MTAGVYDEFGLMAENAAELGLPPEAVPSGSRRAVEVGPGQVLSALCWGDGPAETVLLHGGGQNAHTWDSLVLSLGRPVVAVDLPGHGHSSHRADRDYGPRRSSPAVAAGLEALAAVPVVLIGMSLGGATAIALAASRNQLVRSLVVVDFAPASGERVRHRPQSERGAVGLLSGPATYSSFEEMVAAAVALSPQRDPAAVRRGVRHNAVELLDGSWRWRHDLVGAQGPASRGWADLRPLWDDLDRISAPTMLVRGGLSGLVTDDDAEEMRRRLPNLRVETVAGAGHSVQSDRPVELARLIESFAFTQGRPEP